MQTPRIWGTNFPGFSRIFQKFWTIFPDFPGLTRRRGCARHKKHHLGARTRHVTPGFPSCIFQKCRNKVLYHVSGKVGFPPTKFPRNRTVSALFFGWDPQFFSGRFCPNWGSGGIWEISSRNFRDFSGFDIFALFEKHAFTPLVGAFHKNVIFNFLTASLSCLVLENAEF